MAPPPKKLKQNHEQSGGNQTEDTTIALPGPNTERSLAVAGRSRPIETVDLTNGDSDFDVFGNDNSDEDFDVFGGNDAEILMIADALEVSEHMFGGDDDDWDEEQEIGGVGGVVGRIVVAPPHPLLIPHIYENVLSYLNTPESLLAARSVCKPWKDAIQDRTYKVATLRNVNHIVERYPYGFGLVETEERFVAPFDVPVIERIAVRDPCTTFSKPEVKSYFTEHGKDIKYFLFDANLYCPNQWSFLRNMLTKWCVNLEELVLQDVSDSSALLVYSDLVDVPELKLKRFVVKCSDGGEGVRDHHHYSTVNRIRFRGRYYNISRMSCLRDGGLIARIISKAVDLDEFVFHFNYGGLFAYMSSLRAYRGDFRDLRNLSRLELVGVGGTGVTVLDIRSLRQMRLLKLKTLKLGPIYVNVDMTQLQLFLDTLSGTLENLDLCGVMPSPNEAINYGTNFVFEVQSSQILLMKNTLKIAEFGRYEINTLQFISLFGELESLVLSQGVVAEQHRDRFEERFRRFLEDDFSDRGAEKLRELRVCGEGGLLFDHELLSWVMMGYCPHVEIFEICLFFGQCRDVFLFYSGLRIKELKVSLYGGGSGTCFFEVGEFFGFRGLRKFEICCCGVVPFLRVRDVERFRGVEVVIQGVSIPDIESRKIAEALAARVNYTTFKNCKIVKVCGKRIEKILDDVLLTGVNLPVMLEKYFHAIN